MTLNYNHAHLNTTSSRCELNMNRLFTGAHKGISDIPIC